MSQQDPFAAAAVAGDEKPKPRQRFYFGQIDVAASFVVLVKGEGKVPFDPDIHSPDDQLTLVEFVLNPIDAMNLSFLITRELIAQFDAWRKITWPSLKNIGITDVREIQNKYVKAELVPTGRTWQGRNGTMEETTLKFHAIYEDGAACTAAYGIETAQTLDDLAEEEDPAMSVPFGDEKPAEDSQKATAAAFLPALVNQANGDMEALASLLNQAPIVKDFFTVDSPEVQALLQAVPA
jgi:hypothetical protein